MNSSHVNKVKYNSEFEKYYQDLFNYVRSMTSDIHTAQDIVHETYLRVHSAQEKTTIKNLKAFLYRVAKNQIIDEARRNIRHENKAVSIMLNEKIHKENKDPSQHRLDHERKILLKQAISKLPDKCRQVFILHKFSEKSHKEVAAQLGIAVSTVEKHIIKALKYCRQYVKEV